MGAFLRTCSGAMNPGVPSTVPLIVLRSMPAVSIRMVSNFRSSSASSIRAIFAGAAAGVSAGGVASDTPRARPQSSTSTSP